MTSLKILAAGRCRVHYPGMPRRKKLTPTEMRKLIHSFRGIFKRKPGEKPFAEEWAEYKREEKELEERKFQRLAALGKK
jgi:Fungal HAT1, C-terminal